MTKKKHKHCARGVALLVVLFVIMAVTILALGFLSRSDVELACGQNMTLRTAMDYLAESGLQHARGLILNPQDIDPNWTGATNQQLIAGSSDYYDVSVIKVGNYNYFITSEAYRKKGSEKIGVSKLMGQLRLDPCIAFWTGSSWTADMKTIINGDVYCQGDLSGNSRIRGDTSASGDITITASSVTGSRNAHVSQPPIALPGLSPSDFSSSYYIGTSNYSVQIVAGPNVPSGNSSFSNPAGVYYCNGDVELSGDVNINGMLVVNGNLKVKGANNVITAVKNFPALLVSGELVMEDGGTLVVNGFAQVGQKVKINSGASNIRFAVSGALFILNGGVDGLSSSSGSTLTVTAVPDKATIQTWPSSGVCARWSPAAGAFFRSITRQ